MKFYALSVLALAAQAQGKLEPLEKLASYETVEQLNSVVDWYSSLKSSDAERKLEETPVVCTNEYESPQDNIGGPAGDPHADKWLAAQEWKQFTSKVGKPTDRNAGDVTIEYVKCTGSGTKGAMIFVPGQSEATTKHSEQIYDVIQAGYSPVWSIDHRGQGKSSRLLDNELKGYVELGEDFVTDLKDFVDLVVDDLIANHDEDKLFGICHSMGCAITFRYLMGEYKAQRPQYFNGITAWAPLIKPATDPFPYEVAEAIGTTMNLLGLGEDWAPTKEATFEESYNECNFAGSTTTSYSRWSHSTENCRAAKDVMYNGHLGQCTTGVTGNFAAQFFGFFDEFEDFFGFVKNGLSAPILLQQAGKDRTVLNPPQNQFCDEACSDCKLTVYPESEHNIWTEVDSIRNAAMAEAFAYFDAHSDPMQLKFQNALPPTQECGWSWWSWTCFWQFWPRLGAFIGLSGGVTAAGFMFVKRTKTTSEQMKHAPMRDDNKQSDML